MPDPVSTELLPFKPLIMPSTQQADPGNVTSHAPRPDIAADLIGALSFRPELKQLRQLFKVLLQSTSLYLNAWQLSLAPSSIWCLG